MQVLGAWTSVAAPLLRLGSLCRRRAGGHREASTPTTSHLHRPSRLTLTASRERTASAMAKVYEYESGSSSSEAQKIREAAETNNWSETFELDLNELEKPLGAITRQHSWATCLGRPMKQRKRGTCALVACTMAIDAAHRRLDGDGTRMHGARPKHPDEWLFGACQSAEIWTPERGAEVDNVLPIIKQLGGVPVAKMNAPAIIQTEFELTLESSKKHAAGELTPERVAELLDRHGPCVGLLWVCPWYECFDAAHHGGTLVYRGCGRSQVARERSKVLYGGRDSLQVDTKNRSKILYGKDCQDATRDRSEDLDGRDKIGWHAIVCYEYRFCGEEMHVLVLDDYDDETGPRRWVHVNELDTLHTIHV